MPGYRLYLLRSDGHIQSALEFEAEGDEEAVRLVEARPERGARELWQQARRVRVFPAETDRV